MRLIFKNISFFLIILGLFACGGGGGGGSSTAPVQKTGVFLDAAVSGALFSTTSGLTGITNGRGEFQYLLGDEVVFLIGGIELPSVPGADFVTPFQMAGTTHIDDQFVINILQFLQSLDTDGIPSNGITIPASETFPSVEGNALDFNQNAQEFEAALTAFLSTLQGSFTLVPAAEAYAHFETSLFQQMVGEYNGSFSGTVNGRWLMTIDFSGDVSGSINVNRIGQGDSVSDLISGSVLSDGRLSVSELEGTRSFTGIVTLSGEISGTWSNTNPVEEGFFMGEKQGLAFNAVTVPGVYDFVADGDVLNLEYTFNLTSTGFVPFSSASTNTGPFNWSVNAQGRLILAFTGINATIPDGISFVEGTAANARVTLKRDIDGSRSHEADEILTGSFIKQQGG